MEEARDRNTGLWIEHTDRLYVEAYSSVASLQVIFSGYFRKATGEIGEYALPIVPTSDRVVTSGQQHFGPGFLLSCTAHLQTGNANRGQVYVRARVQRATGTPLVVMHQILGGYLTDSYSPSFPFGRIKSSLDGPGFLKVVTGTDPAAGAEVIETVPTGARWQLGSARITLVADATVASRRIHLLIDDGTTVPYRMPSNGNISASSTETVTFSDSGAIIAVNNGEQTSFLPAKPLLAAGWRITTVTTNLQAGDNLATPKLWVEEWLEA